MYTPAPATVELPATHHKKADETVDARRRAALVRILLGSGLFGLGLGASGRGLLGLRNLAQRGGADKPGLQPSSLPGVLRVHVPRDEEEEAAVAGSALLRKRAAPKWVEQHVVKPLADYVPTPPGPNVRATSKAMPLMALLGGAGTLGGWSLVDAILRWQQKKEIDQDLAAAKAEYETALQSKTAGALDRCYDGLEKQGLLEELKGVYYTALMLSLLGGAGAGYKWTAGRSQAKLLAQAAKQRARQRSAPQPLLAVADDDDETAAQLSQPILAN